MWQQRPKEKRTTQACLAHLHGSAIAYSKGNKKWLQLTRQLGGNHCAKVLLCLLALKKPGESLFMWCRVLKGNKKGA
jgi:hypothetical protein